MSQSSNFVDYVKICCRSGHGGAGSSHLHRDILTSKGGPDGGDGGRGGHIIVKGNSQLWTLLHLKYRKHIIAENGFPGSSGQKSGRNGIDEILEVPLGTIARNAETGEILFEITSDDVGLVGFPNAGKSTLLSVVSAAKPEIADYAFTTLVPNLGIVSYRDNRSFVMADIPGIIEGASKGKGLGIRFLRHIERNSVLLFLVPADTNRTIVQEYEILLNELEQYNPELMQKPRILAISKSDMLDDELMNEMKQELPNLPTVFISSVAQKGLVELKDMLWKAINEHSEVTKD
ncbi:GTP-binding protein [Daphnia sinensis]|uniref:GTP-binding protein n=1 Tax=Daphnia sinensis TaxID=1820382 RepID=A0AAD5KF09_9CRUS|nr:GTP-binding protein [Daphnia sinensis]